jgi:uncharacterized membrane protein YjgN (DUF898 family)
MATRRETLTDLPGPLIALLITGVHFLKDMGAMMAKSGEFKFVGGAANYLGTQLLAIAIVVFTVGIGYPFALVLTERWKAKHATIDGRTIAFTGTGMGLFGLWIKWLFLSIITVGIYLFWVGPQIQKWKWEHLEFTN